MAEHDGGRRTRLGARVPRRGPKVAAGIAVGVLAVALGTAGGPATSVGQVRLAAASVPVPPAAERARVVQTRPAERSPSLLELQLQNSTARAAQAAAAQANMLAARKKSVSSAIGNMR